MTDTDPSKLTLAPSPADVRSASARAICRHHASRLLIMASLLLDDADTADDVVASTIAAAVRDGEDETAPARHLRARLARSVYHRCIGHLAVMERFPEHALAGRHPGSRFAHLAPEERAVLALTVFGGLGVTHSATLLRRDVSIVSGQLIRALRSVGVH